MLYLKEVDVAVSLFVACAIFGEVAVMLECHFSWQVQDFVTWDDFLRGNRHMKCCVSIQNMRLYSCLHLEA